MSVEHKLKNLCLTNNGWLWVKKIQNIIKLRLIRWSLFIFKFSYLLKNQMHDQKNISWTVFYLELSILRLKYAYLQNPLLNSTKLIVLEN